MTTAPPLVSVVMPTFEQAAFLPRAIASLRDQSLADWELVVVDDGSRDATADALAPFLDDPRIRLFRLARNQGMGAALNAGLDAARATRIAYLPSDDVYYREHLASLAALLDAQPMAVAACSGVRHHYNRSAEGPVPGHGLQLVQVMHRAGPQRWLTRATLVTDDLERMFFAALRARGAFVGSRLVSCEWVDHPGQRHKVIREPEGGINPYRLRYRVTGPLTFHSTVGNRIDERAQYDAYRTRAAQRDGGARGDGLRILLVGELAYNADRVLALEERGHRLFGLWMRDPYWYNTVGPLPFGHDEDLDASRVADELARVRPDVIYALLNWQAVPFAREVLAANPGVPFVWHFKEGPFICLEKGTFGPLLELYRRADGRIYSTPEMRAWFGTLGLPDDRPVHVLDGDLPKREWFEGAAAARLSARDGEIHTVVPGRPIGLHPEDVAALAQQRIHLHFYGDFTQGQWQGWIARTRELANGRLHLHPNIDASGWVAEFSRYDAGWLHCFRSRNGGDVRRADWDDLNYPARIATLAAAGVPMLQRHNPGAVVATQALAREHGLSVFFDDWDDLAAQLHDAAGLEAVRRNVWRARGRFTFDAHADALVTFFRTVIADARGRA
jgi:glycosyltransferase involved in cell wall biosynthesis